MGRSKWRPPHPARNTGTPWVCPSGRPRFATVELARGAAVRTAMRFMSLSGLAVDEQKCTQCAGYHLK